MTEQSLEPDKTMIRYLQKSMLALFMVLILFTGCCLLEMIQVLPLLAASIISVLLIAKRDSRNVACTMAILALGQMCTLGWLLLDLETDAMQKSVFILLSLCITIGYESFLIHYYKAINYRNARHQKIMVMV